MELRDWVLKIGCGDRRVASRKPVVVRAEKVRLEGFGVSDEAGYIACLIWWGCTDDLLCSVLWGVGFSFLLVLGIK